MTDSIERSRKLNFFPFLWLVSWRIFSTQAEKLPIDSSPHFFQADLGTYETWWSPPWPCALEDCAEECPGRQNCSEHPCVQFENNNNNTLMQWNRKHCFFYFFYFCGGWGVYFPNPRSDPGGQGLVGPDVEYTLCTFININVHILRFAF